MKHLVLKILILSILLVSCGENDSSSPDTANSGTGQAGSLAKFTITGSYLYIIEDDDLYTFEISSNGKLTEKNVQRAGFSVETIFAKDDVLLLGTQFGMTIYDISTPNSPKYKSEISHIRSCDPVVAQGDNAFVTISSGSRCNRGANQLIVYDIKNIDRPIEIDNYSMTSPQGLGVKNNLLLVADNGLKLFDVSNPKDVRLIQHLKSVDANDIIPLENSWLVVGTQGMYQYQTENNSLNKISQITSYEI